MDEGINLENCKTSLIKIVEKVISLRSGKNSDNLPLLPEELPALFNNLQKTEFSLVVSGEVNRGKSTFINAIIGRNILPTFDKETTSQVFKIINSDKDSIVVVYDNGDRKAISETELVRYGTQLGDEMNNKEEKRILLIEIYTPIKHLPQGVSIIDTPGIGSTFKEHTEIAKEFMRQADAVIYLCSAKHPIVKTDLDFIKNTILPLPTSPNVLFVMSKADQVDSEDALNKLISRIEDQLNEHFSENYSILKRIIPVDSLSMIDSGKADSSDVSELLKRVSNFDIVERYINELIDRQQFFWLVTTFNCVVKYYKRISQYITKQLSEFDLDNQKRQDKLANIARMMNSLEAEMGPIKQRKVLESIGNLLSSFRSDLKEEFCTDKSSILQMYNKKVDALSQKLSAEEINENAKLFSSQLLSDAADKWDGLCSVVIKEIQSILAIYSQDCQLQVEEGIGLPDVDDSGFKVDMTITMSDRLDAMRSKYFTAVFGTTVGVFAINALAASSSTVAAIVGSSAFLGPAGWIIGGGAIVYGLVYGTKKAKAKSFLKAKNDIKSHFKVLLLDIYNQLTKVSLLDGKYESALRMFEKSLQDKAVETVSTIYARAKTELETARQSLLDSSNASNRTKIINQQTLWNGVAKELQDITSVIKEMNLTYKVF